MDCGNLRFLTYHVENHIIHSLITYYACKVLHSFVRCYIVLIVTEVRFIYRLISRKSYFLESIAFFDSTPISRFSGTFFFLAFMTAYNIKCLFLSISR
jgi:hypothetical protein